MVATTPVTIEQAAAILGLSTSTVRRRIRDGRLRAEEVSRPQGIMRLVYLPEDVDSGVTQVSAPDGVVTTTAVTSSGDSMIAYTQTLLLPLVEALERSQATVREQAETIGRLEAENRALVARTAAQNEEALRGAVPVPLARPGAVGARGAGDRRGGRAGGEAAVSPDTLALVALAAVAFIVFVATLVVWVWRRGWRPGEPPRE